MLLQGFTNCFQVYKEFLFGSLSKNRPGCIFKMPRRTLLSGNVEWSGTCPKCLMMTNAQNQCSRWSSDQKIFITFEKSLDGFQPITYFISSTINRPSNNNVLCLLSLILMKRLQRALIPQKIFTMNLLPLNNRRPKLLITFVYVYFSL